MKNKRTISTLALCVLTVPLVSGCTSAQVRSFITGQEYHPTAKEPVIVSSERVAELRNQERLERQAAAEKKERQAAWMRERREKLQTGEIEISSLNDALIMYQPEDGYSIVRAPKANGGDGKYYQVPFRITDKQGDDYVSWWPAVDYTFDTVGSIALNAKVFGEARYHMPMVLVGRYVENQKVRLVNGSTEIVPVFDHAMLFPHPNAAGL